MPEFDRIFADLIKECIPKVEKLSEEEI